MNTVWFLDVYRSHSPTCGLKARNMPAQGNALGLVVAIFHQALKGRTRMSHVSLNEGYV